MSPAPPPAPQAASAFSAILWRLCDASGALGAALVDSEGETVDYAGKLGSFDVRVAAAEWRVVLAQVEQSSVSGWNPTDEVVVRAQKQSFLVSSLSEGYAIVLILPRRAFRVSRRALHEAIGELSREAGLARPARTNERWRWLSVEVQTEASDPRRPRAVWQDGTWLPVTILGRFKSADLDRREVGYMTRLDSGDERLLVREPMGRWFSATP
jgi:hypothetical protein